MSDPSSSWLPNGVRSWIAILPGGSGGLAGSLAALGAEVVAAELGSRLEQALIEPCTLEEGPPRASTDRPQRRLAPWDRAKADRLARELTALLVVSVGPPDDLCREVADDLSVRGVHVEWLPAGGGDRDPLLLSQRLEPPADQQRRREFLRMIGDIPGTGPYVACHLEDAPPGTDVAAGSFAWRADAALCSMNPDVSPLDLAAMVSGAECIITDSPSLLATAYAFLRPVILVRGRHHPQAWVWDGFGATIVDGPDGIGGREGRLPAEPPEALTKGSVAAVEALLDEVAGRLRAERQGLEARTPDDALAELQERVAILEQVNAGLRRRLAHEREATMALVRRTERSPILDTGVPAATSDAAQLAAADEVRELQDELRRVYATKTMRAVAPARRLYGRWRSMLR
jgi:hypothetical protein